MDLMEAIEVRHSVRQYQDKPIPAAVREALQAEIDKANEEGYLQLIIAFDEPRAFSSMMAHYGKFRGVNNYIVCGGRPSPDLQERVGFFVECVVLKAQQLGLNTCWVALTYGKGSCKSLVEPGSKLVCTIALGYGETQGIPRKSKAVQDLCSVNGVLPEWFERGVKAAQLAPTAMNQQKFRFELHSDGHAVSAKSLGGFYSNIDLGIVRYHFQIGANSASEDWRWEA
ncbi:Nitroreductase family protein [Collinsella sp. AK_207A]|uniref:nitroreductase family protein n=1 Tax=Collinsella sp. AK_207A TaxID=2650472 RepID=UPI0012604F38|nr:nitroreductase family protein [Collinsella sp. AK_207A]VWM05112.1 Nitroreductase family protein [Collinsella sp. AK_207A]